jgi:erythromycin esterase-like protein
VLLGEASHGTAEYYNWRAAISRRLIVEKGFSFVAVEGDWPDCFRLNRYVKGEHDAGESARQVLHSFERWPTWMWANEEVIVLAEWLRAHNRGLPERSRVGFFGLDVYSLWDSLFRVAGYLRYDHPAALAAARRAFECFEPYSRDVQEYARATRWVGNSCEDEVVELLAAVRRAVHGEAPQDGREPSFDAEQNALVVQNAEHYYRTMVRGGPESWNVRDRHMMQTLERLLRHHGRTAKAIVWEHNTHVGDARYTDMAADGMVNVGQLARERNGEDDVVLVGFGSYRGSVIAGRAWDAPMERMPVPAARPGSWEDVLHRSEGRDCMVVWPRGLHSPALLAPRGHRAIGVVYHPEYEHGNYVPSVLPRRYDAFLYFEESEALRPLLDVVPDDASEPPETYPSGV